MKCPSCHNEAPADSAFCPSCGTQLDDALAPPLADAPTSMPSSDEALTSVDPADAGERPPASDEAPTSAEPPQTPLSLSDSGQHGRFLPGTTVADRYRIVGLLGRGGMGEVYRADDLKLGQQVALKFLPKKFMDDEMQVERLLDEVRSARKVSHPNVCRVWDIGEAEGQHYVSMEYVDGEDLSSLLRRIGRLPKDKAVEISRQLCAALAAAHDEGVLHRDLKPANIMLDGRGRVKLTDFGLAAVAEVRAGTPIYMAPEQLAGEEVSVQSDVYSLGLVLHELFTGKRVFEAGDLAGLKRQHEQSMTETLTSTSELDPAVDSVIRRCLQAEPNRRVKSALAVAAGLPGADPLAAALAAGETPSPEMIADAGGEGGLPLAVALPLAVVTIVCALVVAWVQGERGLLSYVPLELPPEALEARAREIMRDLGYSEEPVDTSLGFMTAWDSGENFVSWLRSGGADEDDFDALREGRPAQVAFWWRSSPVELEPSTNTGDLGAGFLSFSRPAFDVRGMARLQLDTRGRLFFLEVVPARSSGGAGDSTPVDWLTVFDAAQLDVGEFQEVAAEFAPRVFATSRRAWVGTYPEMPDLDLRIEVAALDGRVVSFRTFPEFAPLDNAPPPDNGPSSVVDFIFVGFFIFLFLSVILGALFLAQRNVRLGKGDRRGAQRLAAATIASTLAVWVLGGDHASGFLEVGVFVEQLMLAIVFAAVVWSFYMAAEPILRRRGARMMVGWSRLLDGRWNDPLVARDVLIGCAAGGVVSLTGLFDTVLGIDAGPLGAFATPQAGASRPLVDLLSAPVSSLVALGLFLIYALLLLIFRNRYLAVAAWTTFFAAAQLLSGADVAPVALYALGYVIYFAVLLRFGLLAFTTLIVVEGFINSFPALDPTRWWSESMYLAYAILFGIVGYALYRSVEWKGQFADVLDEA